MTDPEIQGVAGTPAKRKPTPRKTGSRTTSARKPTTRRKKATSTTLGAAVGAAIAGVLSGLLGSVPWWLWVVLLAVGLGVGYLVHRRAEAKP
ncbi:hypothetical protein [Actinokineospora sp. NBRC 105648]|uniref:hypothetical protein n=1 Tax=Actinokineospora sp. NBRC 105648 TaxID=3032206 RepID=UPI00249FC381|nr:hypothetical protein [Actinokineospora sp. NBRC 105648]GLZ39409.1 hypothetical protein Acsp05_30330 [Actinokineospora sp. NBRC 105648]